MDITRHDIAGIIRKIKPDLAADVDIAPDVPLTKLGLDSLDLMNLYFTIDETFNVAVTMDDESETTQLLTIDDILAHVREKPGPAA